MSVSHRGPGEALGREVDRTVVWLRGEHDMSTTAEVTVALDRAIERDDADVVMDLSGVEFMGAETIGIVVRTTDVLRSRSRSLMLRSPSTFARRIIDVCELEELVDPHPNAAALGSWVTVPATDRIALPEPAVAADVETEPVRALEDVTSTIAPPKTHLAPLRGP